MDSNSVIKIALNTQKELLKREITLITINEFTRIFKLPRRRVYLILSAMSRVGIMNRLKPGVYYLSVKTPTTFEVANTLYQPSYISLETALSFYRIIPENVYSITSITPKHTRRFNRLNNLYSFHHIKKNLFFGYKKEIIGGKKILIAEKEKALLDYIYFVTRGLKKMNDRFDTRSLDKQKLNAHLSYFRLSLQGRKLKTFNNLIKEIL